ncbi:MAG: ATP-binding cassette domain-containing protein [Acidimicrobiales bacterium]|nr:ATP-binding cassette domain-containing protein [Acidimicrobiales bacterium]
MPVRAALPESPGAVLGRTASPDAGARAGAPLPLLVSRRCTIRTARVVHHPIRVSAAETYQQAPDTILSVEDLVLEFPVRDGKRVRAVSGVSFAIHEGETLGLVGESGCGKSSLARAIVQLYRPTSGSVVFEGVDLTRLNGKELKQARRQLQMIFQDPISSLNPRKRVIELVRDPLRIWGIGSPSEQLDRSRQRLGEVGIDADESGSRRPHQFSGGQCQRISIARALMLEPRLLICDEPVSALDVSVQAQVLNLLEDLKRRHGMALLFIAHDLAVVKNISDRVAVMYLGRLCEIASSESLYREPAHPYTVGLLQAIPVPDPSARQPFEGRKVRGELPSPLDPPSGCRFHTRCPFAQPRCSSDTPELREIAPGHFVACHFPLTGVHANGAA